MTRVVAPTRLHFGLFHVPVSGLTHTPDGRPVRRFGGVGLMIDVPVTVTVRPADSWEVRGSLGPRARGYAERLGTGPLALTAEGPPEHVGLGVGTALGMAVYAAVSNVHPEFGCATLDFDFAARQIGRGERSAIGVYGFGRGGLIVDGGKVDDGELARLESVTEFPNDWRVVLVRPPVAPAWYGTAERSAFGRDRSPEAALATTRKLHIIARSQLVRALQDADFNVFSEAVAEFNRTAGEPFALDQGGPYSHPAVEAVIDQLKVWGHAGAGQSSWGPTVFVVCEDPDRADRLAARSRQQFPEAVISVVTANTGGASITRA